MRSQMRSKTHGEKLAQKIVERAIKKSDVFAREIFDRFAGPAPVDKSAKDKGEDQGIRVIISDMPRPKHPPTEPIVDLPPNPEIMKLTKLQGKPQKIVDVPPDPASTTKSEGRLSRQAAKNHWVPPR
jgi:hypothetical protein